MLAKCIPLLTSSVLKIMSINQPQYVIRLSFSRTLVTRIQRLTLFVGHHRQTTHTTGGCPLLSPRLLPEHSPFPNQSHQASIHSAHPATVTAVEVPKLGLRELLLDPSWGSHSSASSSFAVSDARRRTSSKHLRKALLPWLQSTLASQPPV